MQSEPEENIVVVDSDGNAYNAEQRAIAENRARSAAQSRALNRGTLSPQELQHEAEFLEPVAVNKQPTAIVPFTFAPNVAVKPERLNANLAHLGNIIAGFLAREKLYLKALDSVTDRLDVLTALLDVTHAPQGRAALAELHDAAQPAPTPRKRTKVKA